MPKLSLTRDQRRMLCKKYKILDTAPGPFFSDYITYLQQRIAQDFGLGYSEYPYIISDVGNRPSDYWGVVDGTDEQINWFLLHL